MMCCRPYEAAPGVYVSCGGCRFCRINKSRVWQHRILLEASCWELSVFATLTYDDEHLPADDSVDPKVLQKFMKRLRRRVSPLRIRFYGVGEYGDDKGRPHYHVCLFGIGSEYRYCPERTKLCCFSIENVVEDSWPFGFVHIGEINKQSARYISDYVLSYMNFDKSDKLRGRRREFSRMSLRPSIGLVAMKMAAVNLLEKGFPPDRVVSSLNCGKSVFPLGRHLKHKLHEFRAGDPIAMNKALNDYLDDFGMKYSDFKSEWFVCEPSRYKYIMESKRPERFRIERNPVKKRRIL